MFGLSLFVGLLCFVMALDLHDNINFLSLSIIGEHHHMPSKHCIGLMMTETRIHIPFLCSRWIEEVCSSNDPQFSVLSRVCLSLGVVQVLIFISIGTKILEW